MRHRVLLLPRNAHSPPNTPSPRAQTDAIEDPAAFDAHGVDNALRLEDFTRDFRINVLESREDTLVFEMIGVGAPVANAFRRILLSEIPTMAIETVNLYQNTSIIQDEVLAHRLGLIPILADPRKFAYVHESEGGSLNENNTLVFTLKVSCELRRDAPPDAAEDVRLEGSTVLTDKLVWEPQGSQADAFADRPVRPVHDDILVAKMRPGQEIEAELLVHKGVGKTHAKWSPVSTAAYRLLPDVRITEPVTGAEAEALRQKCPAGVFDIEDGAAVVAQPRNCTMCRECVREAGWEERVELGRVRDHFIFTVESTGIYTPAELVREAVAVLKAKCERLIREMDGSE